MSQPIKHVPLHSEMTHADRIRHGAKMDQKPQETGNMHTPFLRVSENNHYFVKDGIPFFWLGDTIWPAFSQYTVEELEAYLEHRKQQGFTVEHVALPWDGCFDHRYSDFTEEGESLWLNGNPATPNEAFFKKVDTTVRIAREKGLLLAILACGGAVGTYVDQKKMITADNARPYGRWLGQRYKNESNVVWVNGFDLYPWMYVEVASEFSAGLREGDGNNHLIFYHPCGATPGMSSNFFQQEEWLAGNFIQTWSDFWNVYGLVMTDYHRKPHKPVVHVEGAYEAGTEYPSAPITSSIIRQQAYSAFLAGGFHTYGHNDIWRKTPYWRDSLDSIGSNQMKILKDFFSSLPWWKIVPDRSVVSVEQGIDRSPASARSTDDDFLILYFYHRTSVKVDLKKIRTGRVIRAEWFDPQSGRRARGDTFEKEVLHTFTSPAWCEDAVLLLIAED